MKTIIKLLLPPILTNWIRATKNKKIWSLRKKSSWEKVLIESSGYDKDNIFDQVTEAVERVICGEFSYERDGVGFKKEKISWPLVSMFQFLALQKMESLTVVDFGGSLASVFWQNKKYLSRINNLKWIVVEQERFVNKGRSLFGSDPILSFCYLEEVERVDVFFCSSTLQYIENYAEVLQKIDELNPMWIIFDRLSLINETEDILTKQTVPKDIYEASYPCRFFSREKFDKRMSRLYEKKEEFPSSVGLEVDLGEGIKSKDVGQLWQRK